MEKYSLSELQFRNLSYKLFQDLLNAIESADIAEDLECENYEGILSISNGNKKYVITQHNSLKEIWVASPIRGGIHFHYNINLNTWLNKENYELFTIIKEDINELFGVII